MKVYKAYEAKYESSAKYFGNKDRAHSHAITVASHKVDEGGKVDVEHYTEYGERTIYRIRNKDGESYDFTCVETLEVI